jgi:hypothetical protein
MASTKKKRGAKVPRSSFRAKPPAKKTTPVAKQATKPKPKAKAAATKKTIPKPPAAKPAAKPAARLGSLSTQTTSENHGGSAAKRTNAISLGEITAPSGTLAIFDVGLFGYLPREALDPAIVKVTVPADRPLRVVGERVGAGRFSDCWDHVAIVLGDGDATHWKKLGKAAVDFARLVCMDFAALDHWQHEDSLDGKADFVFWGRDDQVLARVMGAPRHREGYGWIDLSVADAEAKADIAARKKSENGWQFAMDVRPHSHHFHALAAARANPVGAGTLELAGSKLLLFFTSWGDGVFPIFLDLDDADRPVRVRIQLATAESNAAMRAVNSSV